MGAGALHDGPGEGVEFGAGDAERATRHVDNRFRLRGQPRLGVTRERGEHRDDPRAVLGLDLGLAADEPRQRRVDVVAAQACVAVGGKDLEDARIQFEHGDVERAAAEVVHGDLGFVAEPVQTVGERGGGGFVEDALDIEAGQLAGGFGGLALGVVEIRRDGDDRTADGRAEGAFGVGLELGENQRGNLLRGMFAPVDEQPCRTARRTAHRVRQFGGVHLTGPRANQTFDGGHRPAGLGGSPRRGGASDERRTPIDREINDRGR